MDSWVFDRVILQRLANVAFGPFCQQQAHAGECFVERGAGQWKAM